MSRNATDLWPCLGITHCIGECTRLVFSLYCSKFLAQDFAAGHFKHVYFLDMGKAFLANAQSNAWAHATAEPRQDINEMFMPDAQHPSAAGMRIIAAELEPLVSRLVSEASQDAESI